MGRVRATPIPPQLVGAAHTHPRHTSAHRAPRPCDAVSRSFIYGDLTSCDLKGKKVAIFGLGDSSGYSDNFCDAMDELSSCFSAQGAEIIGAVSTDGYEYEESKSVADGKFIGLACDEDNQPDLSEERVNAWIDQIKSEGMPL